jgi:hypothetical protein
VATAQLSRTFVRERPAPARRSPHCLCCHAPLELFLSVRQGGLCARCRTDAAAAGWRIVYDRDGRIGAIPHNLRAAYNL